MTLLFQVCFFGGIAFILLSFILGQFFDFLGIDGLDLDFDLFGIDLMLPLSPILYILFATVFGGVGLIFKKITPGIPIILVVLIAILLAFIIACSVYMGVIKPLKKAQNTSSVDQKELIGQVAIVTEKIPKRGCGEISYVVNGNSYTSPAKSTDEEELLKGCEVAICWIEDYIFYVSNIGNYKANESIQL